MSAPRKSDSVFGSGYIAGESDTLPVVKETVNVSPEYVHRMLDALITGKPLDFGGAWVPPDVQLKLARARNQPAEVHSTPRSELEFLDGCLRIAAMLRELRNPDLPLQTDMLLQVMKVGEELGEAMQAVVNAMGQNFRKGKSDTMMHVAEELVDTAVTALCTVHTVLTVSYGWSESEVRNAIESKMKFLYGRVLTAAREKVTKDAERARD